MAKENAGVDTYDLWFYYRGSTLRFAAIPLGLIIATAFQMQRKKD